MVQCNIEHSEKPAIEINLKTMRKDITAFELATLMQLSCTYTETALTEMSIHDREIVMKNSLENNGVK